MFRGDLPIETMKPCKVIATKKLLFKIMLIGAVLQFYKHYKINEAHIIMLQQQIVLYVATWTEKVVKYNTLR